MELENSENKSSEKVVSAAELGMKFMYPASRPKSPIRLRYEAEAQLIQKKLGSLEDIRAQLGLSQRKVCQLLLVDPSAWTRWTKGEEGAPPHIYRMLQWYLALHDKYPALDVNFWLSTVPRVQAPDQSLIKNELAREIAIASAKMNQEMKEQEAALVSAFQESLRELNTQIQDLKAQLEAERNRKVRKKKEAAAQKKPVSLLKRWFGPRKG